MMSRHDTTTTTTSASGITPQESCTSKDQRTSFPCSHSQELVNIQSRKPLEPFLINKRKPVKMGPSAVLDRVKAFLPEMERAKMQLDEQLAEGMTDELDIENVEGAEGPVIEMNLAVCPCEDSSDDCSSEEDDESEEPSSEDQDEADRDTKLNGGSSQSNSQESSLRTLKLPGTRHKPKDGKTLIEELPEIASHTLNEVQGEKT